MDKSINKILNFILIVVIFLIIITVLVGFISPLFYSDTSKTAGGNYDYLNESYLVIEKYLDYVNKKDYTNVNNCIAKIRQEKNEIYDNYAIYLNENYKELKIKRMETIGGKNYLVTFTIDETRENKIVLHFSSDFKSAKIYYDKLLMKF
ncbi:MAG: hypothetical protein PHP54_01985 [Clostridia bacterium]|nr:hypothetical protein [Clostridia bacterium]